MCGARCAAHPPGVDVFFAIKILKIIGGTFGWGYLRDDGSQAPVYDVIIHTRFKTHMIFEDVIFF